jgi:hypothetical protein
MGEKENSEFIICVNLRHLRAIPNSVAAGRAGLVVHFFANFLYFFLTFIHLHLPSLTLIDLHW